MYAFQVWGRGVCRLGCSVRLGSLDEWFVFGGYYGTQYSKIISSFWGIVFYIRNIILLGSTTKKSYSDN